MDQNSFIGLWLTRRTRRIRGNFPDYRAAGIQWACVTSVRQDRLMEGIPRGYVLLLAKGTGRIDSARSRTIWIETLLAVP